MSDVRPVAATLVDLLRKRADHQPEAVAFRFLRDGEVEIESVTFGELDRRARIIAAALQQQAAPGARACLFFPPGLDYVAALLGSLYAGLVAVPAYPPRSRKRLPRLEALIEDPRDVIAVTSSKTVPLLQPALDGGPEAFRNLRWMVTDSAPSLSEPGWREPAIHSDSLAIIQYTSGSTTRPRGVMLSHANLLHNLDQIRLRFGLSATSRGVIWLPPYHDMGLIGGILATLYQGFETTLMSPAAFLQRPVRWLQAISKYRATISGGPDFAFDLCARKVTAADRQALDLSSWELAFNGAEPVRWSTMERFAEAFAPCGFRLEAFRPCYGLAEATLMVSSGRVLERPICERVDPAALARHQVAHSADPSALELTGCGTQIEDTRVCVVDPQSLAELGDGSVGEIWVAGASVSQGYFNNPEESSAVLGASINGIRYLRTGDLGYLRDGELFVTGRLKDLIVIRGVNYYPHDIEAAVEASHPALRRGAVAAFSIAGAAHEQLILVVELERRDEVPRAEVTAAVRAAVAEINGLPVDGIALVKSGSIPRTSSGKVRRCACREAYLHCKLDLLAEWKPEIAGPVSRKSEHEIRNWLTQALAGRLNLRPFEIDPARPFTDHGLESVDAVALALDLENWLGSAAPPTLIWDFPSIDALAAHLAHSGLASRAPADSPASAEPIAIIGMGCRFPGAPDPEAFWKLLEEGRTAVGQTPAGRWDHSSEAGAGAGWGAFLDGVDRFDPYFFGIAAREAANMDPQQRLLLEVVWEALENAGLAPPRLAGSHTGVFVGISSSDYARQQVKNPHHALDIYSGTGNALSIAANRISYTLDSKGPSLAVDTACSSSLVAVHLAVESLRRGESSLAIAGGVNLILSPDTSIVFSRARMLAPDGKCKVFDASADGYVRGEGCGVVILKPLPAAIAEGDPIRAVILGTGMNQDGRTNGLTAPNGPSQRALLSHVLSAARISASEIGYVETHGTGTPLGDPIEVQSLAETFTRTFAEQPACWMGSVKANIGHLEPAAGVASLIKTVLALEKQAIPPQIHFQSLNPHIHLDGSRLRITTALAPWSHSSQRLALVDSFGFGGTNAAVILAEAPARPRPPARSGERCLFTLSARSQPALRDLALRYADFLANTPLSLADICFTANAGRAAFPFRLGVIASSCEELSRGLRAFEGVDSPHVRTAKVDGTPRGEPVALGPNRPRPALENLRDLFLGGFEIAWSTFETPGERRKVALPTYPFQRERFWIDQLPAAGAAAHARPLIHRRVAAAVPVFETTLSLQEMPWLAAHVIRGQVVFPAAAYLEMAIEAAMEEFGEGRFDLRNVSFERALLLGADPYTAQVIFTGRTESGAGFQIFGQAPGQAEWTLHCTGTIACEAAGDVPSCPPPAGDELDVAQVYRDLAAGGLEYGEEFRGLRQIWHDAAHTLARIELHSRLQAVAGDFAIHPALLDAALHVLGPVYKQSRTAAGMPVFLERFQWLAGFTTSGWACGQLSHSGAEVRLWDESGQPIFAITGLRFAESQDRSGATAAVRPYSDVHELRWEPAGALPESRHLRGRWLIVPGDQGLAGDLAALIRNADAECEIRHPGEPALSQEYAGVVYIAPLNAPATDFLAAGAAMTWDVVELVKRVTAADRAALRLWLVTRGAHSSSPLQSCIWGLGRVIALEYPALRCATVDLEPSTLGDDAADLFAELSASDCETQIRYREGRRSVARLAALLPESPDSLPLPSAQSYCLKAPSTGSFDHLSLAPAMRVAPAHDEVEVSVEAAGMNFSDVLKALGLYPGSAAGDPILGAEFAGVIASTGERVMGIAPNSFAPYVTTHRNLVVPIPAAVRTEDAACIPVAFLTAAYGLLHLAQLRKGERVLIHAASGGVGLAAIQLAHRAGAQVFATAGTPEKRAFVEALGCIAVYDSRSLDFVEGIRAATGGIGVDVVLNSLAGEGATRSLDLLAPFGRFVEIGKSDIYRNHTLGLAPFQRAISYFALDLDRMFRERSGLIQELLLEIASAFEQGELKPLPLRLFPITQAKQAFRHMAQAKHIGKVLLVPAQPAPALLKPDAAYLVTGGLGALGLRVAEWMAGAGARRIVLLGRSHPSADAVHAIAGLRRRNVEVTVKFADVAHAEDVGEVLHEIENLRGIIHAAGVLQDGVIPNLTEDSILRVLQPKVAGAWNLHRASQHIPLDFFVLFSSLSSLLGSPGQGNYAAGNAFLDALASHRQASGLPALSVNWGPWEGAGMASQSRFGSDGVNRIHPAAALRTLEQLLLEGRSGQVVVASVDWNRLAARVPGGVPPLLAAICDAPRQASKSDSGLRESLIAATSEERRLSLETHILEHVGRVSGIPVPRLDRTQSLGDLGIDSLTALELTSSLEQTLQLSLPLTLINGDVSVSLLAAHIAERLVA